MRINIGDHIGGIPFTEQVAYCEFYGFVNPCAFMDIIDAMDETYIDTVHKLQKNKSV